MKSHKYNFYKNSKYFIIASLLIALAGLIVGLTLKLNTVEAIGSSVIVNSTIITLVSMVITLVYFWIRYDLVTGFCYAFSIFFNISLMIALLAIIRTPITDNIVSVISMVILLTVAFNSLIFYNTKDLKEEKLTKQDLVQKISEKSFKSVLLCFVMFLVVLLLSLIVYNYEIIMFVRPMLVGLTISAITTMFIIAPIWSYFYKEKTIRKKEVDETVFEENNEPNVK